MCLPFWHTSGGAGAEILSLASLGTLPSGLILYVELDPESEPDAVGDSCPHARCHWSSSKTPSRMCRSIPGAQGNGGVHRCRNEQEQGMERQRPGGKGGGRGRSLAGGPRWPGHLQAQLGLQKAGQLPRRPPHHPPSSASRRGTGRGREGVVTSCSGNFLFKKRKLLLKQNSCTTQCADLRGAIYGF